MRKHLLYILLLAATFTACKKSDDPVFDESPDERISKTLEQYKRTLEDAEYGWKGLIFPSALPGTAIGFYFKFDGENRVQMFSDFDSASSVTMRESSWRLKALQQPCLLFDTYSYVHVLCDPDAAVNNGYYGSGLASDFEFILNDIAGDTIHLTGRMHGSKAILVKATSQEAQDYYESKRNREFDNISRFLTYFKQLNVGGDKYDVYVNKFFRAMSLTRLDVTEGEKTFNTFYYYTSNGIALSAPFDDNGHQISAFEDVSWDAGSSIMKLKTAGMNATITGASKPIIVDTGAGRRWWNKAYNDGAYWASYTGFHVDGVDDAYNVQGLAGYRAMIYYPQYGSGYDWMGILASTNYGPAFGPKFNPNGTVSFTSPGNFGTVPAAAATTVSQIRSKFIESTGFYFVQTSNSSFDMVSARDARSWITWQY